MSENVTSIVVVAGETSGDLHGSALIKELKLLNPSLHFFGIGGDRMKEEGVSLVEHVDEMAVMGFTEVIWKYPFLKEAFIRLIKIIEKRGAARAILIDYPGFNLRLARKLSQKEIPVTYFISPQLWAWKEKRIKIIKNCVDHILCIFPFEERWYKERGVEATFIGNPLIEQQDCEVTKTVFFDTYELKEKRTTIALLPGSRQQEVDRHLPIMIDTIRLLSYEGLKIQGVIGQAPAVSLNAYDVSDMVVVKEKPQLALRFADVGIVSSGTASLEAAIYGTPAVVIYKMSGVSWIVARFLAKVSFVSMTNLVAQKQVFPELLQRQAKASNISSSLRSIIESSSIRNQMLSDMAYVREKLGSPGAVKRAARMIHDRLT